METQADPYFKQIIARRDRRFDGRFYFGVRTTGIYCRPACPAKPKPENIVVFKSPSEAERAGFRACLRCHPDWAPGSQWLDGTLNTVSRGLKLIAASPSAALNVQRLARSLGMTDRHLRRLFDQHLGASPIEIMVTQRLHLAKQMIQESSTPITDIAYAAGFQSIRRFNEAFQQRYRRSPSAFRKSRGPETQTGLSLKIPIHLPYDWPSVLAYLRRHETYGLERVENDHYCRFVPRGKKWGSITVSHQPGKEYLDAEFLRIPLHDIRLHLARLKHLFDTDHNPVHLPSKNTLSPKGIRVPGSFDPFETAVAIILSQLVSSQQARAVLKKLIQRLGRKVGTQAGVDIYEFPSPAILAKQPIAAIGIPGARARAITELSRAVLKDTFNFHSYSDLAQAKEQLLSMHGIGSWTATVIAMRCLGDADAFPDRDLIIQRALEKKLADPMAWTSSRAYLTHTLWRDFAPTLSKIKSKENSHAHVLSRN